MNVTPQELKWERDGRTVYTLMHHGWHDGEEQFRNRFYFTLQYDHKTCTSQDAEQVAAKLVKAFTAHDKLVEVLKAVRDLLKEDRHIPPFLVEAALLHAGEPI